MTLYNDTLKMAVMRWTCQTHPSWEDISRILNRIRTPHFYPVEAVNQELGLLVAGEKLTDERVQVLFLGAWQDQDAQSWQPLPDD